MKRKVSFLAACGVYAFLRFGLGVEDTLSLAAVTGLTFPAILRSKLTFFRVEGKEEGSPRELSLPLDVWYRNLQELCMEEVNSRIADATARKMRSLRRILSEQRMVEILSDHIAAEPREESRAKHQRQVEKIQAGPDANHRLRLLARLMLEIIPEATIQELLEGEEA